MAPGPLALSFVRSYVDIDDLPYVNAEVALVGRSNVGKSSLLNALAQRKGLAKTSKTPGATRLMNAFELAPENSGRWVMDLPGYGFAKVPLAVKKAWTKQLESYLAKRQCLRGLVLLMDVRPSASANILVAAVSFSAASLLASASMRIFSANNSLDSFSA